MDIARAEVTNAVHSTAFQFMKDWLESPHSYLLPSLDTVKSTYFQLLSKPGLNDVHLLENIVLEDGYGGHEERNIIEDIHTRVSKKELNERVKKSAWKGGAQVLATSYIPTEVLVDKTRDTSKEKIIKITVSKRKLRKLIREPYWFFYDSKNTIIRNLRHLFKPY